MKRKLFYIATIIFLIPFFSFASEYSIDLERGSTQYAKVFSDLGITGGDVTMSVWIKPESLPSDGLSHSIFFQGDVDTHVGYTLSLYDSSGTQQLCWKRERGGISGSNLCYDVTLATDTWYHVVGRYSTSDQELYLNGISVAGPVAYTGTGTGFIYDAVSIGADYQDGSSISTNRLFDGLIDEVLLYDTALSTGDISDLYSDPCNPVSGAVARWALENNLDDSISTNDMADTGSPSYTTGAFSCSAGGGEDPVATSTPSSLDQDYADTLYFYSVMLGFGVILGFVWITLFAWLKW